MERNGCIKKCDEMIHLFGQELQQAVERDDFNKLRRLVKGWRLAQENWLCVARGMSPEKAHAVMIDFAMNVLTNWMKERHPGPPPSVLTLYPDGPISDEEFRKTRS